MDIMSEENNKEKSDLVKFKEKYKEFQLKYNLPDFSELNEEFQIEKVSDNETDFFLKEIRACISEKFFSYLRFLESILTPTDAPMFVFAITKAIGTPEKEKMIHLYKLISRLEIEIIELNLTYSEQKEAETIKNYNLLWKQVKKEFLEIVEVIKKNWDNKIEDTGKGYFG
jgi:hypothetical protein